MAAGREGLVFDPTVTFIVRVANGSNAPHLRHSAGFCHHPEADMTAVSGRPRRPAFSYAKICPVLFQCRDPEVANYVTARFFAVFPFRSVNSGLFQLFENAST
jgi:hypothetical protein